MTEKNPDDRLILKGEVGVFSAPMIGTSYWAFFFKSGKHYESHVLKKGDVLMVFNDAARSVSIWSGVIDFDYTACRQEDANGRAFQRLSEVGVFHGIQKDVPPNEWARMFTAKKPAYLIRHDGKK